MWCELCPYCGKTLRATTEARLDYLLDAHKVMKHRKGFAGMLS